MGKKNKKNKKNKVKGRTVSHFSRTAHSKSTINSWNAYDNNTYNNTYRDNYGEFGWSHRFSRQNVILYKAYDKIPIVFNVMPKDMMISLADVMREAHVTSEEIQFNIIYGYVTLKFKKLNIEVPLFLPLGYMSFKQDIAMASVNYDLNDIQEAYQRFMEKFKDAKNNPVNLFKAFVLLIKKKIEENGLQDEIEVEIGKIIPFASMHRHPSRMSFSGSDNDRSLDRPGILHIHKSIDGYLVDSVIYLTMGYNDDDNLIEKHPDIEYPNMPSLGIEIVDTTVRYAKKIYDEEKRNVYGYYIAYPRTYIVTNLVGFYTEDRFFYKQSEFYRDERRLSSDFKPIINQNDEDIIKTVFRILPIEIINSIPFDIRPEDFHAETFFRSASYGGSIYNFGHEDVFTKNDSEIEKTKTKDSQEEEILKAFDIEGTDDGADINNSEDDTTRLNIMSNHKPWWMD